MAVQQRGHVDQDTRTLTQAVRRRSLVAGAAALVVGMVAKQTAEPAYAVGSVTLANGVLNGANNETAPTYLLNNGNSGFRHDNAALIGESVNGPGLYGSVSYMSTPQVPNTVGVYGDHGMANGVGVQGLCDELGGTGVRGTAAKGNGVVGMTSGTGIVAGVYGTSATTYGIIGSTTASGYSGLTAITSTAGVAALAATSTVPTAYAAYFTGTTVVQGNFVAFAGAKSAAVKDASGQHRLVYCVESPESWFEDFGRGKLVNGTAQVALDKIFAEIAHTNDYHVFVTGHDESNGLYVTDQTLTGFTVREYRSGASSGAFSWRVVAKRKDIAGERLAKFDMPKINYPDPAKLPQPEPPASPK